jgi:hypothetical protein
LGDAFNETPYSKLDYYDRTERQYGEEQSNAPNIESEPGSYNAVPNAGLEISDDMVSEVTEFLRMTLEEVRDAIDRGEFIPITRLVSLAHFIRHGIITAVNDDRLQERCARIHRQPGLFSPEV